MNSRCPHAQRTVFPFSALATRLHRLNAMAQWKAVAGIAA
jgi:hypothetical protein